MQILGQQCIIDAYRNSRTKDLSAAVNHEGDFRAFRKKWSLETRMEQVMPNPFNKGRLIFHLVMLKSYSFLGYKRL